ncbi:MAG: hypothetical protein UV20_C0021G0004 [Candidatus Magasanikbacteria bacterium GW2011_GWA2_42_32]|uniref:Uncharacterized protein n=1 Tax=Candidatus Magasanikbacteria bacterium GW2011_GWA2_42_32 TaxID=1619039 RepID=A0A0G1D1I9_9BACT|nr:MAG: hypothetical protein UV20_C0021G0004 [Candidatus Magasanikbacteria bacterium GW2011_GWA2_42_32]
MAGQQENWESMEKILVEQKKRSSPFKKGRMGKRRDPRGAGHCEQNRSQIHERTGKRGKSGPNRQHRPRGSL